MSDSPQYASFRDYLALIRKHRWIVLVVTLLGAGGALFFSYVVQSPKYKAEASLQFRDPTEDAGFAGLLPSRTATPEARAAVGAESANQRPIVELVRKKLHISKPVKDLQKDISARAEVRTNLVVIEAKAATPGLAARIANTVGEETIRRERRAARIHFDRLISDTRDEFSKQLRGKDPFSQVARRDFGQRLAQLRAVRDFSQPASFSEQAVAPHNRVQPRPVRNTILGVAGGLLLGILLALLRAGVDRRLSGARDIQEESKLPLLGVVRNSALGRANFGDPETGRGEAEVDLEAFRILHAHLEHLAHDRPLRRILVTSPLPDEGKSTVAASLAVVSGLAHRQTVLMECDLRRPVLAERLGVERSPGLVEFLTGAAAPQAVLRSVSLGQPESNGSGPGDGPPTIAAITAGSQALRPAELLGSGAFADFIAVVSRSYETVVLDSSPLLPVSDTLDLVKHVDAIVLCVRSNQTTRDQLRAALDSLRRLPDKPIGLVVTGVGTGEEGDYGFYQYAYGGYYR